MPNLSPRQKAQRQPTYILLIGPQRRTPTGAQVCQRKEFSPDLDELLDYIERPEAQTGRRGANAVPRFVKAEVDMLKHGQFAIASEIPPGYWS